MRLAKIVALLTLTGCQGKLQDSQRAADAPPGNSGGDGGGELEAQSHIVTGTLRDYDEGEPVANLTISTEGITPTLSAVSGEDGTYLLGDIPAASAFYVTISGTGGGYRPTVSPTVTVLNQDVIIDLAVVTQAYAMRLYTSTGRQAAPNTSIVIAELRNPDGTPLVGIPAANISLTDAAGNRKGLGPFFIGPVGNDIALAQTETAADVSGRARVVFLDVETGMLKLEAIAPNPVGGGGADAGVPGPDAGLGPDGGLGPDAGLDGGAAPDAIGLDGGGGGLDGGGPAGTPAAVAVIITTDGGATLAVAGGDGGGGGGGGGTPAMVSFTEHVYPILQRASAGGAGCGTCHTPGGVAGNVIVFTDGAAAVHPRLTDGTRLVNVASPASSELLTNPLYEQPANHPNAFFLTTEDSRYQTLLRWISAGAPL